MKGAFQIVLHAHLPFVRHPENEYHLEENWLFEAISETYLPLLDALDGLERDGIPGALTVSLSQPLLAMLDDELLRERFARHLGRLVELGEKEIERTAGGDPAFAKLAAWYHARFSRQLRTWNETLRRDLPSALARLHRAGRIELITCVGTHGSLPLMLRDESRRGQIVTAARQFERRFGFAAAGMWMGECAYVPGVEQMLADAGVRYTFVDTHGIEDASARPARGTYAPLLTDAGVAFFGRDRESSSQVWSAVEGYPGDFAYREFYRDIGFDLDLDYIAPYIHPDGIRLHTGYKYHAVTGEGEHKAAWDPDRAAAIARTHGADFVRRRREQLERAGRWLDVEPLVTSPYDAELYGHWWFEGPWFLDNVLREAAAAGDIVATTPSRWLDRWPVQQVATPAASSWGDEGYFHVWLNPENAWMVREMQATESRLAGAIERHAAAGQLAERALNQMARELLLAQSSDWAFIVTTDTAVEYAEQRTREHVRNARLLGEALDAGDAAALRELVSLLESRAPIFPDIDFRDWAAR